MALKMVLLETNIGVEFEEAYARVAQVDVSKGSSTAHVHVFASEAARRKGAQPLEHRTHNLSTDALRGDILPAVYGALKGLAQYSGAEDC